METTMTRSMFRKRSLLAALATAAALLLTVTGILLVPRTRAVASPMVALGRATASYTEFEDVELWVRLESKAMDALNELLGGKIKINGEEMDPDGPMPMRVLIRGRDRLLFQRVADPGAPLASFEKIGGFDGETLWFYDPEDGFMSTYPAKTTEEGGLSFDTGKLSIENLDLLRFLSWDFLQDLQEESTYEIREVTWPADDRAQRRVFRIEPRKEQGGRKVFWAGSTVTIDARRDLIERMVIELSLGPVSLLSAVVEVAATNQGLDPALFFYQSHVPAGTPVKEVSKEKEEEEPEELLRDIGYVK
jgi:hypothetical protein